MKNLKLLNVILVLAILFLAYNYFVQTKSFTGAAVLPAAPTNFQCDFISPEGEVSSISDIGRCCYAIENQLKCDQSGEKFTCYNVPNSWRYEVNSETYGYCEKSGFALKKS